MIRSAKHFAGRNVVGFVLIGLSGLWLSGCSTDATRLSDSMDHPFGNPFASASNGPAAPTPSVTSQPVAASPSPVPNTAYSAPAHPSPIASAPLAEAAPASTGTLRPPARATVAGPAEGWTAVGGSPVLVIQGDSAESLGRRYGVPTTALLGANGLKSSAQVHPGMRIIVPVYNARGKSASFAEPIPTAIEPKRATRADAKADDEADHPKAKPRKLADSQADAPEKAKTKKLESDNSQDAAAKAKAKKGQSQLAEAPPVKGRARKSDVSADAADAKPNSKPEKKPAESKATAAKIDKPQETTKVASVKPEAMPKTPIDPTPTSRVAASGTSEAPKTAQEADAGGANPEFRWPARGRIIQGFKSGGNDGINISVPEGTSVRAAESGVVAYAGSELKGYGNLVLIRHPNGFVTAYANNGEIDVKRGETVKRGQVIAKSGESGNVSAPQLHFELRDKSGSPVDPTNFLAGI